MIGQLFFEVTLYGGSIFGKQGLFEEGEGGGGLC